MSGTSSRSAARSSSSRSSSTSSTCRAAGARRLASRPTPRCSRISGRPIRQSTRSSSGACTRSCAAPTSTRCRCCSTRRPAACTRPSTRPSPRPVGCRRPIRTCRTSPFAPSSAGRSGTRSWPARPTCVLLAADYSQIELRILAHVSGDVHLREAFERRADIHRETAARVLKKDPADVTADERSMAKMVNFGLAYGMSDFGLSVAREHPARRGAGVHQLVLRGLLGHQLLHDAHQGDRPRAGQRDDAVRSPSLDPRAFRRATRRFVAPASGWRSTCPSRARPRTSSRSR